MQLLISDANIFIDLESGSLIQKFFTLPYKFMVPDVLYYEELEDQHSNLLILGLQIGELTSESTLYAYNLAQEERNVSANDCLALALAMQEKVPLLTGDRALRNAAENNTIIVMGTIWVVEQMIRHQILTISEARISFDAMEHNGRRLPWGVISAKLKALEEEL